MNQLALNANGNQYLRYGDVDMVLDYAKDKMKILSFRFITRNFLKNTIDIALDKGIGKIVSNCRIRQLKKFREAGFVVEGLISGYYRGEDGYCVSLFVNDKRAVSRFADKEDSVLYESINNLYVPLKTDYTDIIVRTAAFGDIPQIQKVISGVFEVSYSHVFNEDYLEQTMSGFVLNIERVGKF